MNDSKFTMYRTLKKTVHDIYIYIYIYDVNKSKEHYDSTQMLVSICLL